MAEQETKAQRKSDWLWTIGFMLVACIGLGWLLLPAVQGRGSSTRSVCVNQIRQLTMALYNYHDVYGTLPPAYTVDENGNRLHSWRTLILPFMEQKGLYEKIRLDEPWDSEYNRQFHATSLGFFSCPLWIRQFPNMQANEKRRYTTYQLVTGRGTAFEEERCTSFNEFQRGRVNTILIVESTAAVHWMSPLDVPIEMLSLGTHSAKSGLWSVGSLHSSRKKFGTLTGMADGAVLFLMGDDLSAGKYSTKLAQEVAE